MKSKPLIARAVLWVLLLSAPAQIGMLSTAIAADQFTPAPSPSGDRFLVYFYRLNAQNMLLRGAEIMVDGKKLFELAVNEYAYAYLPAGKHTIRVQEGKLLWEGGGRGAELTMDARPGETRYARVAVGMTLSETNPDSAFVFTEVKPLLGGRQLAIMHSYPETLATVPPEFRQ